MQRRLEVGQHVASAIELCMQVVRYERPHKLLEVGVDGRQIVLQVGFLGGGFGAGPLLHDQEGHD